MTKVNTVPYSFTAGETAMSAEVNADFASIVSDCNANLAASGVNGDITKLTGLTTPLSISQGGTGQQTAAAALTALGGVGLTLANEFTAQNVFDVSPQVPTAASGDNSLNAASTAFVTAATNAVIDAMWSPGDFKLRASISSPTGKWLYCDGRAVSRTTYADLFSAIGTDYGVGDGTTTFNLPDGEGVFLRGYDNGRGYDRGRVFGAYQADAIATHTVAIDEHGGHTHGPGNQTNFVNYSSTGGPVMLYNKGAAVFNLSPTTASATTGVTASYTGENETRVKNITYTLWIKY